MKVKNLFYTLLLIFILPASTALAKTDVKLVAVGNFSSLEQRGTILGINFDADFDADLGIGGGLLFEFRNGNMGFETGIIYSPRKFKSATLTVAQTIVSVAVATSVTYFDVPLVTIWHLGKTVDFIVGGYIAFSSDASFGFDYGLSVGIGFNLSQKMFISARHNLGLGNAADNALLEQKFKTIQLMAGYKF